MRLMKYVGNASSVDATAAIAVGDGRPTIYLGGMGEMADHEIANANAMGHILVEVDDGGLSKMKVESLDAKASKLGVQFEEDDGRDEKISKLRERLAAGPEDMSELAIGGSGISVPNTAASTSTTTTSAAATS